MYNNMYGFNSVPSVDRIDAQINELKKKGYILGLSTLRNEDMISVILEQFSFDFLVLMNGGVVKVNGKGINETQKFLVK